MDFDCAMWTAGVKVFKVLYLKNCTGELSVFCFHYTPIQLILKTKEIETSRTDPLVGTYHLHMILG